MDVFESCLNTIIKAKSQEIKSKLLEREQLKKELHSNKEESVTTESK